jgi:hypothetical protein
VDVSARMDFLSVDSDLKAARGSLSAIKGAPQNREGLETRAEILLFFIRRCIKRRDCTQPHCLYGIYSIDTGRCPGKNEKMRRGFQRSA